MKHTIKTTVVVRQHEFNSLQADVVINAHTEDGTVKVEDWQVVKMSLYKANPTTGTIELCSFATQPTVLDEWKRNIDYNVILNAAIDALTY